MHVCSSILFQLHNFYVFQKAKAIELLLSQTINTLPKRDPDPEIPRFKQTRTDPLISQAITYHTNKNFPEDKRSSYKQ